MNTFRRASSFRPSRLPRIAASTKFPGRPRPRGQWVSARSSSKVPSAFRSCPHNGDPPRSTLSSQLLPLRGRLSLRSKT
jgi:hypothetical protein